MSSPEHLLDSSVTLRDTTTRTRVPPVEHRWLRPVGVRLDGDELRWDYQASVERAAYEHAPQPGLLDAFLRLHDGPAEAILEFARDHAALGLCRCGQPAAGPHVHEEFALGPRLGYEPISLWRYHSARAEFLIRAANRLRGKLPAPLDYANWQKLLDYAGWPPGRYRDDPNDPAARDYRSHRALVAHAVSRWLAEGNAVLALVWEEHANDPMLHTGGREYPGMFTALGLQVALACSRAESLGTCDGCGHLFPPRRAPRAGERSYCEECRRNRVPVRDAKRDHRERQRAARGGK
jgi:hypothetical protein